MSRQIPTIESVIAAIGNLCRYCDLAVDSRDAVITHSYWQGLPFISHRACKDSGFKAEALECQSIDRSCNECKYFKRGGAIKYEQWNEDFTECQLPFWAWWGWCDKFKKPQTAEPMTCMGMECFEHRKLS